MFDRDVRPADRDFKPAIPVRTLGDSPSAGQFRVSAAEGDFERHISHLSRYYLRFSKSFDDTTFIYPRPLAWLVRLGNQRPP